MSGPTDPAEEHFDKGLWGWASTTWEKLMSTGTGLLKVQVGGQDADVEVVQQAPADLAVGLHGYDGTSWQRLGMLFGYYDRWVEDWAGTVGIAGTYAVNSSAVPAGYIYILQAASLQNNGGARGSIKIYLRTGGTYVAIGKLVAPGQYDPAIFDGSVVLKAGDFVRGDQESCLVGDGMFGGVWGYKMKLSM